MWARDQLHVVDTMVGWKSIPENFTGACEWRQSPSAVTISNAVQACVNNPYLSSARQR